MSIVYRAQHLTLGRTVALKLLSPELSEDESFRERFTRESRLAAALDHPNVIPIYEAGEEQDLVYIAMRYVPGSNLKALLERKGPLDAAQVVSVIGQIASALNAAHDMDLVHRDVKPSNILVVEAGGPDELHHVYLSDFGIAKQRASSVLTMTGMFVGTADYASPEQIEGKELDQRSDVYSLGCVLFECLTGNRAYERDSEVALMYAQLLEPPPSVRDVRPELPPEIDDVIAKAMAKNPDERHSTTKELASALRATLSPQHPAERTSAGPSTVMPQAPPTVLSATQHPPATATPSSPDAPSLPDASAPPPAASGERPMSRFGGNRIIIATGVLALIIVAAVLAVVFLGGGGEGENAAPKTPAIVAPKALSLLATVMPTGIAAQCRKQDTPRQGAGETELCRPPRDAPTSFPETFSLSFFRSGAALGRAYAAEKAGVAIGNCGTSSGDQPWIHVATGKTGGHRVCGSDENGDSVIVWTHEKLGSPDHVDMLGIAHSSSRGANLFRGWWNAVNDDIGKCRPKLPEDQCLVSVKRFEQPK
jgi:serine/threonine-protein kinase